MMIFKDKDGI